MRPKYEQRIVELRSLLTQLQDSKRIFQASLVEGRVDFDSHVREQRANLAGLKQELERLEHELSKRNEAIDALAREKTQGFPWLARALDEFLRLQDREAERALRTKSHPAMKAADEVKEVSKQRRAAEKKAKVLEYQLRYYEAIFPWLTDLTGEGVDDLLIAITSAETKGEASGEDRDPAADWLTPEEYAKLPTSEKFQLALDRYWQGRRTKWQVGRDYERFIGYNYEQLGFKVEYQGILEGLDDLGRDLVVSKETVQIIQCKRWSREKEIREKHINQLYGTMVAYGIDHDDDKREIKGVLYTTTRLSDRAKQFAEKLGIQYVENCAYQSYPSIKCNVSRRGGEKIYHLPFDQQYDRVLVEEDRGERYVATVAEAESLGFRRAFHWRGTDPLSAAP
jgi:hypothetical protein